MKISGEEKKHTNVPLILKDKTFKLKPSLSMRRKYLTVAGEANMHLNCVLDSKDWTFEPKIKSFKSKMGPSRWRSN